MCQASGLASSGYPPRAAVLGGAFRARAARHLWERALCREMRAKPSPGRKTPGLCNDGREPQIHSAPPCSAYSILGPPCGPFAGKPAPTGTAQALDRRRACRSGLARDEARLGSAVIWTGLRPGIAGKPAPTDTNLPPVRRKPWISAVPGAGLPANGMQSTPNT